LTSEIDFIKEKLQQFLEEQEKRSGSTWLRRKRKNF
jgi:hypothetical protein